MIYVYAPSMAIIPWIMARCSWDDIIVISNNKKLLNFCRKCEIKYINIESNLDFSFNGLRKYKNYIHNIALDIEKDSDIFFSHNSHDYWGLYLMKYLFQNNSIYYVSLMDEHKPTSIKKIFFLKKGILLFKDRLILFVVTRYWFSILSFNKYLFLGQNVKTIQKLYQTSSLEENTSILQKNQKKIKEIYNIHNLKYILVDQGETFYTYPEKLQTFLVNFSKNNTKIYLKQHPNFETVNNELIENLINLPRELPIELILESKTILIGIASNALKHHHTVVSLLKLITFKTNCTYGDYYGFLNGSRIVFPKTITELDKIISDIK